MGVIYSSGWPSPWLEKSLPVTGMQIAGLPVAEIGTKGLGMTLQSARDETF